MMLFRLVRMIIEVQCMLVGVLYCLTQKTFVHRENAKMFNLNSRPFPAIKSRFRDEKGFSPFHPPHGEWNSVGGILFCKASQLNSGEWLIEDFYASSYRRRAIVIHSDSNYN